LEVPAAENIDILESKIQSNQSFQTIQTNASVPVLERSSGGSSGFWEWLHFVMLGIGPGWVMLDCMFVEVPYFQAVQPEGLKLASRMSVAASLALATMTPLYLYLRNRYKQQRPGTKQNYAASCTSNSLMVPLLTCLPLALAILASLTWDTTLCFGNGDGSCVSMAIYAITFIASTVGTMQTIVILPWMSKTFAPHHISAVMSGSNFGSMFTAVLGTDHFILCFSSYFPNYYVWHTQH
jgi:hypothetical protein